MSLTCVSVLFLFSGRQMITTSILQAITGTACFLLPVAVGISDEPCNLERSRMTSGLHKRNVFFSVIDVCFSNVLFHSRQIIKTSILQAIPGTACFLLLVPVRRSDEHCKLERSRTTSGLLNENVFSHVSDIYFSIVFILVVGIQ